MKKKTGTFTRIAVIVLAGIASTLLTITLTLAGCATTGGSAPPPAPEPDNHAERLAPALAEGLRKYFVPSEQTWNGDKVAVYYLDPRRFEEFKAELDAGGRVSSNG